MKSQTEKIKNRYSRIAKFYDILEKPMEAMFSKWRNDLLAHIKGEVLEVGVGTGKNLKFYPDNVHVTAIDFSPEMIEQAKTKVQKQNLDHITLLVMDAQDMDFPDDRFDTIITSCVFCSVPDPVKGLLEIRRVCKPDGRVIMLEHVRSHKPFLGKLMDILNPIPVHIWGANINRETEQNLTKAGLAPSEVKDLWLDIVKLFIINLPKEESHKTIHLKHGE